MIDLRLLRNLELVASRNRHRRLLVSLIAIWTLCVLLALLALAANRLWGLYWTYLPHSLAGGAVLLSFAAFRRSYRGRSDYRFLARRIEQTYPELNARLLTAVEQPVAPAAGRLGFLQDRIIQQALAHVYRHGWSRVAPAWQLVVGHALHLIAFLAFVVTMLALVAFFEPIQREGDSVERAELFLTQGSFEFVIAPGNTEVERGASLLVESRFRGPLPPDATLAFESANDEAQQLAMTKSLEDPIYGGRIPEVHENLIYHVTFADSTSETYRVTVFDYPDLQRADAQLTFPDYTSMEDRLVQDVRTLSAVEGTNVELLCYMNKPVARAELVDRDGQVTPLIQHPEEPLLYSTNILLETSIRLELKLTDDVGRANKQPPRFVLSVVPNLPPKLKLLRPSRDLAVSPLEELQLAANAWDDYGLKRIGLSLILGGQEAEEVVLASAVSGKDRVETAHLVELEELDVEPDQLLTYHFWAEDAGPDGGTRRVFSDLFFAEVRHFEEIFRQGEQPPGGASQQQMSGAAQESQKLGELQKEIVNATWSVIRREFREQPTDKFADDVATLLDSQTTAMEMAEALNDELKDNQSIEHMMDARRAMLAVIEHLAEAHTNSEIEALKPALAGEQAAYQALLKLRAREHQVVRSQASAQGGGGGGGNRSQQQLDQLDLEDNENRYETERTAQAEQSTEDRETRQVLNRLRELARRQDDLNDRVKELQSALQEAESEAEREGIRRQLQRLQEEQEEILRDLDELQDRMSQPENMERMSDEQQQLEEARENVRQSSEALQEGQVSHAITSGTRAQREFEELRDEFRRRSADRFEEQMREMRQQAQELDESEQRLAEEIGQMVDPSAEEKSLRNPDGPAELEDQFRQQQQDLESLLERMRDTVHEAEESEPLLAEELYDSARRAMQQNLDRALDATARSIARGFPKDAQQQEEIARQGIQELREGVENAAEHVLGDETDSLRRARAELDQLTSELEQERARAAGSQESQEQTQEGQQQQGQQQQGEQQQGEQQQGEQQQGPQQQGPQQQGPQQQGPQQQGPHQQGPQQQGPQQQGPQQQGPQQQGPQQQGQPQQGQPQGRRQGGQRQRSGGLQRLNDRGGVEVEPGDVTNVQRREMAPLTGEDFLNWSDRLRDVEEMMNDAELRAEAARIRDRARGFRRDLKRHSQPPNWDLVNLQVIAPLNELYDRVNEELMRRASREALVPIDRDPVPPRFDEAVRLYYERLGTGE
jgi:hypothetical protein